MRVLDLLRRLLPFVFGVAILGVAIAVYVFLGPELNASLGTTVASNVLLVVLILVTALPIVAGRRREEDLQVKEAILEKWDTIQALGGVRRDIGVLTRSDPKDPAIFTVLPARIQRKFQRKYADLWQAWKDAKAVRLTQTGRLESLYLEVRNRVQAIRDETPIPEIDPRKPTPFLETNNLFHGAFEEVRYRGGPKPWSPGLLVDDIQGNLLRYSGYVIVSGAPDERRALQARLQTLFDSADFNRLATDIVRTEADMTWTSPSVHAFEAKRADVIQDIKWKHPGK